MTTTKSGGITLTEDHVKDIYEKLNTVEKNVGDVRSSIGSLHVVLKHVSGDFDRLEEVLESLEKMLYGKGEPSTIGLLTRIVHLERQEEKRSLMVRYLWIAIIGLIVDAVFRFISFTPH